MSLDPIIGTVLGALLVAAILAAIGTRQMVLVLKAQHELLARSVEDMKREAEGDRKDTRAALGVLSENLQELTMVTKLQEMQLAEIRKGNEQSLQIMRELAGSTASLNKMLQTREERREALRTQP